MKPLARIFVSLGLLTLLIVLCFAEVAQAAEFGKRPLQFKDEGPEVAILQFRLREAGYYRERVDGIFGTKTKEALIKFQKAKGVKADGVAGGKTYDLLPNSGRLPSRGNYTWDDVILLARVIHAEARSESFRGQVAVGSVILNRVDSPSFPDTIRSVVLQEGQFSTLADGQIHLYPNRMAIEAAKAAIMGYDPTHGALYFYNPHMTRSSWMAARPVSVSIGDHIFAF